MSICSITYFFFAFKYFIERKLVTLYKTWRERKKRINDLISYQVCLKCLLHTNPNKQVTNSMVFKIMIFYDFLIFQNITGKYQPFAILLIHYKYLSVCHEFFLQYYYLYDRSLLSMCMLVSIILARHEIKKQFLFAFIFATAYSHGLVKLSYRD